MARHTAKNITEHDQARFVQVGARIREVRTSRGMKQEDLAAKLGMVNPYGPSVISQVERGFTPLSLHKLCKFADALGVEVRDLFAPPAASETPPVSSCSTEFTRIDLKLLCDLAEVAAKHGSGFAVVLNGQRANIEADGGLKMERQ